jgi:hypothetical protein
VNILRRTALAIAIASMATMGALNGAAIAATCPFDGGGSDAINDGLVLTRYALGITGAPLVASTRYASLDPLQVKNNIECVGCALDMNGDGQINTVDTTIIARHLAGFTGASLTNGLALGSAPSSSRPDTASVTSFLANGCAAVGSGGTGTPFVQGGNSFIGLDAELGTNNGGTMKMRTASSGTETAKISIVPGQNGFAHIVSGDPANVVINPNLYFRNTISGGGAGTGLRNYITRANYGTIGGGAGNIIDSGLSGSTADNSTIGGGVSNYVEGNAATIPGGEGNQARGTLSFAAGFQAIANGVGEFVWNSSSGSFNPQALGYWGGITDNTFNVRASRGVNFTVGSTGTGGCTLAAGSTSWGCSSDRALKERIVSVNPRSVLEKVATLPISTWVMKGYDQLHMGPMAQDFRKTFGLGRDDKTIQVTDAQGVALAAIQGLNEKLSDEVKSLRSTLAQKSREAAQLKARLDAIEKKLGVR